MHRRAVRAQPATAGSGSSCASGRCGSSRSDALRVPNRLSRITRGRPRRSASADGVFSAATHNGSMRRRWTCGGLEAAQQGVDGHRRRTAEAAQLPGERHRDGRQLVHCAEAARRRSAPNTAASRRGPRGRQRGAAAVGIGDETAAHAATRGRRRPPRRASAPACARSRPAGCAGRCRWRRRRHRRIARGRRASTAVSKTVTSWPACVGAHRGSRGRPSRRR